VDDVGDFWLEMAVGLAVGVAGAVLVLQLMRHVSLPGESLYAIRTLVAAAVIYGAATLAHGSGFLAVFIAGLLLGDAPAPFKREIERFQGALANVAEITVFAALGLTFHFSDLGREGIWFDGILLALLLGLVARPLVVALLLAPMGLRWAAFIAWGGLKGAVPILLATFALVANVDGAPRIYNIIVVVVTFSVIVQGSTISFAARRLGIPMRVTSSSRTRFAWVSRRSPKASFATGSRAAPTPRIASCASSGSATAPGSA
jgi:cell volume regulation protein A